MSKKQYICQNCGGIQSKWMGKCPDCNEWNTFQEEIVSDGKNKMSQSTKKRSLDSFEIAHPGSSAVQDFARTPTGIGEFDRVLGGGIVAGSFVLLGGDPGVGKSTLMLQVAQTFANTGKQVLYISGEESLQQIQLRAQRLDIVSNNISIVAENKLEDIIALGTAHTADMIIVDSIQTIYSIEVSSFPGSVTQVRTCAQNLMQFAKQSGKPVFTIGHVTKEGNLAGPKLLEHLVDTVLYLEGERYENFRVLRGVKNRFGSTSEVGIFAMEWEGMVELLNPSALFLEEGENEKEGSVITAVLEGNRPIILEIQALTSSTSFGYPQRTSSGIDKNRLQLLIAVLQRHTKTKFDSKDVYANIIGGIKSNDRATDLAVALALLSSVKKSVISNKALAIGEIGLSGEIRKVIQLEKRIEEAEKLGFDTVIIPKTGLSIKSKIKIIEIRSVKDLLNVL